MGDALTVAILLAPYVTLAAVALEIVSAIIRFTGRPKTKGRGGDSLVVLNYLLSGPPLRPSYTPRRLAAAMLIDLYLVLFVSTGLLIASITLQTWYYFSGLAWLGPWVTALAFAAAASVASEVGLTLWLLPALRRFKAGQDREKAEESLGW